jgi:hypothetical protein
MAGLQTIIDSCNGITINRRNVVGVQYTRNETPRVSQTPTKNPWKISIEMPNSFRYSQARALMEAIDTLDTIYPEVITFGNNPNLSWLFAYQGVMNAVQRSIISTVSFVGDVLTLTNLPVIPATRVLFEPNDLIQFAGMPYPFTVTQQVLRGTDSTVSMVLSRPNILTTTVVGSSLVIGNACQFNMFCPNMPTYKLIPGGQLMSGKTITNNALLEWSDKFFLYEFVSMA